MNDIMNPNQVVADLKNLRATVSIRIVYPVRHGRSTECWASIYVLPNGLRLVILSQIPHHSGMSITNSVKEAVTYACEHFALDPKQTVFIEHYSEEAHDGPATFDVVQEGEDEPLWRRLNKPVAQLAKEDVWEVT